MTDVPLALPPLPAEPLVSVLIASYNYAAYLPRALDSVLAQSYPHIEIVLCDDGSIDASPEIAAAYAQRHPHIRWLAKENGGAASALNAAYQASQGTILCLLDADDFFAPEKVARVVAQCRTMPKAGLVLHALGVVDAHEQSLRRLPALGAVEEGWLADRVRRRGGRWRSMPASALTLRRAVADRIFPIPEDLFRSEADGFINTLAPLLTQVAFVTDVLGGYRLHGTNLTGTHHIDRAVVERRLDALQRKMHAANERLNDMKVSDVSLALVHNLNYHEHRFMQALLAGAPLRELLPAYGSLARRLLADDLYGLSRKALGIGVFAVAMMLPIARRSAWLTHALSLSSVRRMLARIRASR